MYLCTQSTTRMIKRIFQIMAVALLAVSCESDYQTALLDQEDFIDKYITSQLADYTVVRNEGVNRVIIREGSGSAIEKGDQVSFIYRGYVLTAQGPTTIFTEESATAVIGEGDIIKGIDKGLVGAKKNEESVLLFSAQYGYGKGSLNMVPEASALMFRTIITNVVKKAD